MSGACLICVWGSLRFADAQHVCWSSLVSDDTALRGICSRSKTNRRGSAFGVLSVGLLTPVSAPETSWTSKFMSLLDNVRARIAHDSGLGDLFAPDALFFHSDVDECKSPCSKHLSPVMLDLEVLMPRSCMLTTTTSAYGMFCRRHFCASSDSTEQHTSSSDIDFATLTTTTQTGFRLDYRAQSQNPIDFGAG